MLQPELPAEIGISAAGGDGHAQQHTTPVPAAGHCSRKACRCVSLTLFVFPLFLTSPDATGCLEGSARAADKRPARVFRGLALPAAMQHRRGHAQYGSRQPLFGNAAAPSDQLQISIEAGQYDLDSEIDQLRSSVGRLKQVIARFGGSCWRWRRRDTALGVLPLGMCPRLVVKVGHGCLHAERSQCLHTVTGRPSALMLPLATAAGVGSHQRGKPADSPGELRIWP